MGKLISLAEPFATEVRDPDPIAETWNELVAVQGVLSTDVAAFTGEVSARAAGWEASESEDGRGNDALHSIRDGLHGMADRCPDLTKQLDLAAKLVSKVVDIATKELEARKSELWTNSDVNAARGSLENARTTGVEVLGLTQYFVRQADWLHERFPEAALRDVEGLVKLVDQAEIEAHDWSLTPGRYVGVAPEEEDEDFDFQETMRSIHADLQELNQEAGELAARIAHNFEGFVA